MKKRIILFASITVTTILVMTIWYINIDKSHIQPEKCYKVLLNDQEWFYV